MTELQELKKHAEDARGQAGAISEYFEAERKWLLRLEADLRSNPRRSKADIRSAVDIIRRRLGRTERLIDRDTIEKDIAELSAHLPGKLRAKLQELNTPLHVALAGFVAELSRSQGALRQNFEELQLMVDTYEAEKDVRRRTIEFAQITRKANTILGEIQNSLRWIQSFTVSVGHYLAFITFLEEL